MCGSVLKCLTQIQLNLILIIHTYIPISVGRCISGERRQQKIWRKESLSLMGKIVWNSH